MLAVFSGKHGNYYYLKKTKETRMIARVINVANVNHAFAILSETINKFVKNK